MPNYGGLDMQKLMKQAQDIQKKAAEMQESLKEIVVETTSGGGMVTVKISGAEEIVDIKIDKQVIDPEDKAMLEELIIAAVNEAIKKAKKVAEKEMAKVTGGIKLPGM
ncbi:MAG: nucleoid-associated protein, YbaB/EbfC family [Planctomycetes bacterium RBG_16_59_8]|nr:MAG: nucleoid-associated protein, YbaB/EbfC family [Planctomycetes bacterium RBG_16_59_8]